MTDDLPKKRHQQKNRQVSIITADKYNNSKVIRWYFIDHTLTSPSLKTSQQRAGDKFSTANVTIMAYRAITLHLRVRVPVLIFSQ